MDLDLLVSVALAGTALPPPVRTARSASPDGGALPPPWKSRHPMPPPSSVDLAPVTTINHRQHLQRQQQQQQRLHHRLLLLHDEPQQQQHLYKQQRQELQEQQQRQHQQQQQLPQLPPMPRWQAGASGIAIASLVHSSSRDMHVAAKLPPDEYGPGDVRARNVLPPISFPPPPQHSASVSAAEVGPLPPLRACDSPLWVNHSSGDCFNSYHTYPPSPQQHRLQHPENHNSGSLANAAPSSLQFPNCHLPAASPSSVASSDLPVQRKQNFPAFSARDASDVRTLSNNISTMSGALDPRGRSRSNASAAASVGEPRPRQFACHICGNRFSRKHHLESHMVTHSDDYPFVCNIPGCKSKFRRNQDLLRHIRNVKHGNVLI